MTIIAKKPEGGDFKKEIVPAGSHVARCYSVVHIGTVRFEYLGEEKELNKVRISWELPTELRVFNEEKGKQPMVVSKEYTLSLHEKSNLRKDLESWRGKNFTDEELEAFDVSKLIGVPALLSVTHTTKGENTYANITSVSGLIKGMECPDQINPSFEFSHANFDQKKLDNLPEFLRKKISESKEYMERTGKPWSKPNPLDNPQEAEAPFPASTANTEAPVPPQMEDDIDVNDIPDF